MCGRRRPNPKAVKGPGGARRPDHAHPSHRLACLPNLVLSTDLLPNEKAFLPPKNGREMTSGAWCPIAVVRHAFVCA